MSQPTGPKIPKKKPDFNPDGKGGEPGWADGLRQLYNSVLQEPLPDSFDDLLKKLDKGKDD
ncbi:NepR family anti-sigma factor [Novosphingobium marinum]|uniref:NepR family anti-sigma factor n=1 Tax=Novosphingobium marinum TaxID=1514948 RepID=UPI001E31C252|nr:NepR family anti-sigma factor [Novosphingobium marinum]